MLETKLKTYIRKLVQEVEEELDEVNVTGNIDGYDTPNAFTGGKKKNEKKRKKTATQLGHTIVGEAFKAKGYKPKDPFGARIIQAINTNITESDVQDLKREGDDNAKILEKGKAFLSMAQNGIKEAFKFKFKIHPDVDFPMRRVRGSAYFWFKSREDMEKYLKNFLSDLKKLDKMITIYMKKPTLKAQQAIVKEWQNEIMVSSNKTGGMAYGIMMSDKRGQSIYEGRKPKRPVNRWLELKNDETRTPNQKLAIGLKELKYQLAEVEMFFRWYNKIRSMNELSKDKYWKRTHRHIYNVKERLINIATSIKELDQ
jgi:hypothetical protein